MSRITGRTTGTIQNRRRQNQVQSTVIFVAMIFLLGYLGTSTLGLGSAILVVAAGGVIGLVARSKTRSGSIFDSPSVRRITRLDSPELHDVVERLSNRADLESTPELAYIASPVPNAMSVATAREPGETALIVTEGLFRKLSPRELSGVLAHEIAHIKNRDLSILGIGDVLRRTTGFLSQIGIFLLLFNLPLALFSATTLPLPPVLLLIGAPLLSHLLVMALSRRREFAADIGAVELTGDPDALASALFRIAGPRVRIFQGMIGYEPRERNWFRSHPAVEERISRLLEFSASRPVIRYT